MQLSREADTVDLPQPPPAAFRVSSARGQRAWPVQAGGGSELALVSRGPAVAPPASLKESDTLSETSPANSHAQETKDKETVRHRTL